MSNIITATFNGQRTTYTEPLYQWDYGQVLQFTDLTLPESYQVDFVNSVTAYSSTGGSSGVAIPDDCLKVSGLIKAYVVLHTGYNDGETEYVAFINVIARPQAGGSPSGGGGGSLVLTMDDDGFITGGGPQDLINAVNNGIVVVISANHGGIACLQITTFQMQKMDDESYGMAIVMGSAQYNFVWVPEENRWETPPI